MKTEKSCGAVIYFKDGDEYSFLIINESRAKFWGFPKGHIEKNESEEETAIREILEETGLIVGIEAGFKEKLVYSPKKGTKKEVVFFLAKAKNKDVTLSDEVSAYKLLSYDGALNQLTYEDTKRILKKAMEHILKNNI